MAEGRGFVGRRDSVWRVGVSDVDVLPALQNAPFRELRAVRRCRSSNDRESWAMMRVLSLLLLFVALPVAAQPARPVTSVGISMPSIFSVTNSPVTGAGTLTIALRNEVAAMIFAGPPIGSTPAPPSFRPFGLGDLPASLGYVQSFGARCDGTHDDSSAFQLADAAGAGTIMVPPGTCVIGAAAGAAQALIHQLVMPPGAKLSIS
jgi:hypothetical protein